MLEQSMETVVALPERKDPRETVAEATALFYTKFLDLGLTGATEDEVDGMYEQFLDALPPFLRDQYAEMVKKVDFELYDSHVNSFQFGNALETLIARRKFRAERLLQESQQETSATKGSTLEKESNRLLMEAQELQEAAKTAEVLEPIPGVIMIIVPPGSYHHMLAPENSVAFYNPKSNDGVSFGYCVLQDANPAKYKGNPALLLQHPSAGHELHHLFWDYLTRVGFITRDSEEFYNFQNELVAYLISFMHREGHPLLYADIKQMTYTDSIEKNLEPSIDKEYYKLIVRLLDLERIDASFLFLPIMVGQNFDDLRKNITEMMRIKIPELKMRHLVTLFAEWRDATFVGDSESLENAQHRIAVRELIKQFTVSAADIEKFLANATATLSDPIHLKRFVEEMGWVALIGNSDAFSSLDKMPRISRHWSMNALFAENRVITGKPIIVEGMVVTNPGDPGHWVDVCFQLLPRDSDAEGLEKIQRIIQQALAFTMEDGSHPVTKERLYRSSLREMVPAETLNAIIENKPVAHWSLQELDEFFYNWQYLHEVWQGREEMRQSNSYGVITSTVQQRLPTPEVVRDFFEKVKREQPENFERAKKFFVEMGLPTELIQDDEQNQELPGWIKEITNTDSYRVFLHATSENLARSICQNGLRIATDFDSTASKSSSDPAKAFTQFQREHNTPGVVVLVRIPQRLFDIVQANSQNKRPNTGSWQDLNSEPATTIEDLLLERYFDRNKEETVLPKEWIFGYADQATLQLTKNSTYDPQLGDNLPSP